MHFFRETAYVAVLMQRRESSLTEGIVPGNEGQRPSHHWARLMHGQGYTNSIFGMVIFEPRYGTAYGVV